MSFNLYKRLRALFPGARLQVGSVIAVDGSKVTVALPDGATMTVRGSASVGSNVYVRDGAIDGPAPSLTTVEIEI